MPHQDKEDSEEINIESYSKVQKYKNPKKLKRFNLKFSSEELLSGNRKADSNYYRRKIRTKKIAYIYSLIKNIDQLVVVASFTFPIIKTGLIDRFLILAQRFQIEPVIILTKADLCNESTIRYYRDMYIGLKIKVIVTATLKKEGIEEVKSILMHRTSAMIGHSGVGKTTLLNYLDPHHQEKTQDISNFTKRGRHTTTRILRRELSFDAVIYDMPGLKEMDFIDISANELKNYYKEFSLYKELCLYKDCSHSHEPDCKIKEMAKQKTIYPERYQNYLKIFSDLDD